MRKLALTAAVAFFAAPTFADELETEATATPLQLVAEQVCDYIADNRITATDDLAVACATDNLPDPISDGSRFANRGIGAEMNVLIRNVDRF